MRLILEVTLEMSEKPASFSSPRKWFNFLLFHLIFFTFLVIIFVILLKIGLIFFWLSLKQHIL